MKKLTTLLALASLSSAVVAGPVQKEQLNSREIAQLSQTQAQSAKVMDVQAGNWVDDYGTVTICCIVAVAALTVGIVALSND